MYLYILLSIHMYISLSIFLSIWYIYLSIHMYISIYLSIYIYIIYILTSISLFVNVYFYLYISINLSTYLPIYNISIYMHLYLYISLFIFLAVVKPKNQRSQINFGLYHINLEIWMPNFGHYHKAECYTSNIYIIDIHISSYMSIYLPIYLSIYLSIFITTKPSVKLKLLKLHLFPSTLFSKLVLLSQIPQFSKHFWPSR